VSSGILSVASGASLLQRLQLGLLDPSPDPAGVDEAPVRIVVGEQQSAKVRSRALGVRPSDHHEFLTVQAFDLDPQPAVAGRVGRIGAFRDDALELQLARLLMEGRAPAAVIIAVMQRRRGARQQFGEPLAERPDQCIDAVRREAGRGSIEVRREGAHLIFKGRERTRYRPARPVVSTRRTDGSNLSPS